MTSSPLIESLTRLISEKPDLAAALRDAHNAEEAVEILAQAGEEGGVAVDKAALAAHFAEQSAAATNAKLSDADLDEIAGGGTNGILASILTLGIACATMSLDVAARGYDCGKVLENL